MVEAAQVKVPDTHRPLAKGIGHQRGLSAGAALIFLEPERQDDCTRRFAGRLRFLQLQLDRDLVPTIRDM
jgi:hypothetical protein